MADNTIVLFMGKRVDEMTRDELIDAVKLLGTQLTHTQTVARETIECLATMDCRRLMEFQIPALTVPYKRHVG